LMLLLENFGGAVKRENVRPHGSRGRRWRNLNTWED
jgi:hypothetical protein